MHRNNIFASKKRIQILMQIVVITEKLSCGNFIKIAVAFFIARQKRKELPK